MKLETCGRCNGQGTYYVTLGKPGQDPREIEGGYQQIQWNEPTGPHPCGACNQTGKRKRKPPIVGSYVIQDDPPAQFKGQEENIHD